MDKAKWNKAIEPVCGAVFGVGLLGYLAAVWLAGGAIAGAASYAALFCVLVLAPGMWLCGKLLPKTSFGERFVLGYAFGSLLLMLSFVTLGRLNTLAVYLPSAALGLLAIVRWFRHALESKHRPKKPTPQGWLLLGMFGVALGLFALYGVLPAAKPSAAGNMEYNMDLLWSVGNAASAQWGAPLRDIRTAGGILHYHYLADVTTGLLGLLGGQGAWDAVCYFNWPFWFGGLLAGLYFLARRLTKNSYAALFAPFAAAFMSFLWQENVAHLLRNMNGVVQSYLLLVCALLALAVSKGEGWRGAIALCLTVTALAWGKSMLGALILCALAAAWLVYTIRDKRLGLWLPVGVAGGALGFGLLYALLFSGAINNLVWSPSLAAVKQAAYTLFALYLPVTLLYLASVVQALLRFEKLSMLQLTLHAMVPGGIAAYCLYDHYSGSEGYFLLAAGFCMCLCAVPLVCAITKKAMGRVAVGALALAALAGTIYSAAPELRRGTQVALRARGMRPEYEWVQNSITTDDEAAADYLREHMDYDEVFATNRNAQDPVLGEGVFHYYTAASERQAFVESWRYAMDYSIDYFELRHNLETVSDGIFAAAGWEEASALAQSNGIQYLLVHLPTGGHAFAGVEPVFESETVLIYRA